MSGLSTLKERTARSSTVDLPSVATANAPNTVNQPLQCKLSWSCRMIDWGSDWGALDTEGWQLQADKGLAPRIGDVAIVEVASIGNHTAIMTAANERLRLYPGDRLVGVFGNRYATDAYEAEVTTLDKLHILTNAGMLGTVRSKHHGIKPPTSVTWKGFLADGDGVRLNLKSMFFRPTKPRTTVRKVLFVVGTGMNSGKTTTARQLVKGLVDKGVRVAACKLTGSVSHHDLFELRAASPTMATDFSDYGFPSTYLCDPTDLTDLFHSMVADAHSVDSDVIVIEIADGVLQRETSLLLRDPHISEHVVGVVLTAPCALSAMQGIQQIHATGHQTLAVSGIISNAPLYEREFKKHCDTPLYSSQKASDELASRILQCIRAKLA